MNLNECSQYLRENQGNLVGLTERLALVNSGSFHIKGLQQVIAILQQEFAALGCEQTLMPVAPFERINDKGESEELELGPVLRCWKRPNATRQVLLMGHADTVYGRDHKFQMITRTGGDIINGPGVADMKGGLVIMLWALKAFEQLPEAQNLGWEVLINCDEEIGSPGSREIIDQIGRKHNIAFVFEPAMDDQGTLAGARKGSGKFTFVMRGKAAHAGRSFTEGRNAICKMAEAITLINTLNNQREGVTLNIGVIHGGAALNIVPDCCVVHVDVRYQAEADIHWLNSNFNALLNKFNTEQGYKFEIHGGFGRKPKILDPKTLQLYELVKTVGASLSQDITWQPSGGCSDGNNLAALGIPNVDTLGPRGGKIHSDQEYIFVPSLVERANLFAHVLAHLSSNGL